VLAASGLVAGEGLAGRAGRGARRDGVVVEAGAKRPPSEAGIVAALAVALLILAFLYRGGRAGAR
jgi:hypothetical protein